MTTTRETYLGLIERLRQWNGYDFHRDYELSDAILLTDGWTVHPDPWFEGGIRWTLASPNVPTINLMEQQRPRLLLNPGVAMGVVPFGYTLNITTKNQMFTVADVLGPDAAPVGWWRGAGPTFCVAVLIAALSCKMDQGL